MRTFNQFLNELNDISRDYKAWVSPFGNVYKFNSDEEHGRNIHPDLKNKVRKFSRQAAEDSLDNGYARIGKHDDMDYIYFNYKHKNSLKSALHALEYLNLLPGHKIVISHETVVGPQTEKEFTHPIAAKNYIKSLFKNII